MAMSHAKYDIATGALNFVCVIIPLSVAGLSERREISCFAWGVTGWRIISFCRWVDTLWVLRTGGKMPQYIREY